MYCVLLAYYRCVLCLITGVYYVLLQVCTGDLFAVLSRHYQTVSCLRCTDDGSHIVSGGEDNLLLVWSLARYTMSGHWLGTHCLVTD